MWPHVGRIVSDVGGAQWAVVVERHATCHEALFSELMVILQGMP